MARRRSALRCDACGAPIRFGFNRATKKRIPMEVAWVGPDNDPRPNLAVSRDALGSLFARPLRRNGDEPLPGESWGLTHFAVCPARKTRRSPAEQTEGANR